MLDILTSVFKKYLPFAISVCLAFVLGKYYGGKSCAQSSPAPLISSGSQQIRQAGYHFINPLLECEGTSGIENNIQLSNLKHRLESQVDNFVRTGVIESSAIYFRDLNNGPWFGLNEDTEFTPASLLKVPVMIAYLKESETNPSIMNKQFTYQPVGETLDDTELDAPPMNANTGYSVEDLIDRMIIYSDNRAFNLLTSNIEYKKIEQVHIDLGLTVPDASTPEDFISVREYASIFRVLFNSSYLSRTMSEKALSILSQANYKKGLVLGVGNNMEVAHKYGVRKGSNGINQLHDCGIIYYPDHPYLVCIMTKGHEFKQLELAISGLSRTIFTEVESHYPAPSPSK